ncbi:hypothetical protein LTR84_007618 [Exophiala bonariae]|uniref:FAD-binding PCMH-type domain-containing protein n=1 Tax=Exophiala bonariae TaxID=1690606 RepID=A0AAV9NPC0_9EURO|nr:hypothetical protein LTR84_007618 [Exophiala bonariae]
MAAAFKCKAVVPRSDQALLDIVPRWSETSVELPALILEPEIDEDIVDAIKFAKTNGLILVVANGTCGPFVPITSKTLYMKMSRFNHVDLDMSSETVRIGGGATTAAVMKAITKAGYYTLWPNSDAVGYVGCLLGGGSSTMNGLHGYMVDAVVSIQLITADGSKLEVGPFSTGKERDLFNVLCGAGFGFGVITSVVMKAFRISNLHLDNNNNIWTRRVILPANAIEIAARTFAVMHQVPPALTMTMVCTRSPPTSEAPGIPITMITGTYFGPSKEGEVAAASLFDEELITSALESVTELVSLADINLPLKPLSINGGHKGFSSTFLESIDAKAIQEAFDLWLQLGDRHLDAYPTSLVFNRWNTEAIIRNGQAEPGRGKFFEHRTQSMVANVMRWSIKKESVQAVEQFGDNFLRIVRSGSAGPPKSIPNNQRPDMDLEELYSRGKIAEIKEIKYTWDPLGMFWCPV